MEGDHAVPTELSLSLSASLNHVISMVERRLAAYHGFLLWKIRCLWKTVIRATKDCLSSDSTCAVAHDTQYKVKDHPRHFTATENIYISHISVVTIMWPHIITASTILRSFAFSSSKHVGVYFFTPPIFSLRSSLRFPGYLQHVQWCWGLGFVVISSENISSMSVSFSQ